MEANVTAGDNLVMVLEYDLGAHLTRLAVHVHITVDIIVANVQGEFMLLLNIRYTRIGSENKFSWQSIL